MHLRSSSPCGAAAVEPTKKKKSALAPVIVKRTRGQGDRQTDHDAATLGGPIMAIYMMVERGVGRKAGRTGVLM